LVFLGVGESGIMLHSMKKTLLLKLVVFLAAFLLFQIELIISKALLPGFGGSYLVWAGCVLFFQVALLAGYAYSHVVTRILSIKHYGPVQAVLLFLPLLFFPIKLTALVPQYRLSFMAEIVWLLLRTVGAPFLVLATVSVMAQNLLSASDQPERHDPYFLYGTSNLGSFLGLLTYPFLFERSLNLDTQLLIWEIAFAVVAVAQAGLVYALRPAGGREPLAPKQAEAPVSKRDLLRWMLLAAAGTAMFLSVTNIITFELAAIPLFWMLPLSIYLFTYYLSFKQKPWRPALLKVGFHLTLPVGMFLFLIVAQLRVFPAVMIFTCHLAVLFVFCMFCQNELATSRPASAGNLTTFYLALAAGGAAGSLLVSFMMPLVSPVMLEYLIGFLLAWAAVVLGQRGGRWRLRDLAGLLVAAPAVLWPYILGVLDEDSMYLTVGVAAALGVVYLALWGRPRGVVASLIIMLAIAPFLQSLRIDHRVVYYHRNFYGSSLVYDSFGKRFLRHGSTTHGAQYLDEEKSRIPIAYFHPSTPAGELLGSPLFSFHDIAVFGLGAGTMACYAGPGQNMDYYEINPDIKHVAQTYFTYLKNSSGRLRFIMGDARLSIARATNARYDLIVMDAFSSDAIPVHLITTDAISLYLERLKPGGMVLINISNRSINLQPMLYANARALNLIALYKNYTSEAEDDDADSCSYMVLTANPAAAKLLENELAWTNLIDYPPEPAAKPWTDRYSNLISAIWADR
jgi:hypothetical protein